MKKLTFFLPLFLLLTFSLFAQAPQAICYQAAAKDATGKDLIQQDISIRASIMRGDPNGILEWQESHEITTDDFGLFSIEVGKGLYLGGNQTELQNIKWSNGKFWLSIEMDPLGGTDFTFMGATKIISVPYSLFANKAGTAADDLDRDSTNEIQTLTFQDNVLSISGGNSVALSTGAPFTAPGSSYDLPQGVMGENVVLTDQVFNVPPGKNLYLLAAGTAMKIHGLGTPGADFVIHPTAPNMPIFGPGDEISECECTGVLIDTIPGLEPVIIDLTTSSGYSVPSDKVLFIKSGLPDDVPGRLQINNQEMEFFKPDRIRGSLIICFPEGIFIKKPASYPELVLTGYLVDKI